MTNQSHLLTSPTQGFVADYQVISKEARRHDPFYKDFLVGYDCVHQAAAFLDDAENGFVRLLVFRDEKRGPFETSELSAFNQSIPYLRSAAMISRGVMKTMALRHAEPFERRGEPILYLGPDGCVLDANAAAERAAGRVFDVVGRRVKASRRSDQGRLDRAILGAIDAEKPGLVTIMRWDGSPVMALVLPVGGKAKDVFFSVSSIVVFIDPISRPIATGHTLDLLRDAAGLTVREFDVVRLVGTGSSPKDAARLLDMGYGTLRNHLKAVFAKLGVHTQGELVALIQRFG